MNLLSVKIKELEKRISKRPQLEIEDERMSDQLSAMSSNHPNYQRLSLRHMNSPHDQNEAAIATLEKEILKLENDATEEISANQLEIAKLAAIEAQAQRDHEEKLAKIELMKFKEQRLAAEAARDAAALAKAQESEQLAAILKSLKGGDDES